MLPDLKAEARTDSASSPEGGSIFAAAVSVELLAAHALGQRAGAGRAIHLARGCLQKARCVRVVRAGAVSAQAPRARLRQLPCQDCLDFCHIWGRVLQVMVLMPSLGNPPCMRGILYPALTCSENGAALFMLTQSWHLRCRKQRRRRLSKCVRLGHGR